MTKNQTPIDPVRAMLAHDAWATGVLIEACRPLSPEQLDCPFEIGLGSIRATIAHTLGAVRSWTNFLAKRSLRGRIASLETMGPAEWLKMLPDLERELLHAALSGPMDEMLTGESRGKPYTLIRSHAIVHVATHGAHHRAQCLNMLRHIGVVDVPLITGMRWGLEQTGS